MVALESLVEQGVVKSADKARPRCAHYAQGAVTTVDDQREYGGAPPKIAEETTTSQRIADFLGVQPSSAWREEALARAAQMYTLLKWLEHQSEVPQKFRLIEAIEAHLEVAKRAAHDRGRLWGRVNGAAIERTMANLDAAEANLLRMAPLDYLSSDLPNLGTRAREHLATDDPRIRRLQELEVRAREGKFDEENRNDAVAAIQGAVEQGRREQLRVRSFRNIIIWTSIILAVLASIVAVAGLVRPSAIPICFQPDNTVVCPTSQRPIELRPGSTTLDPRDVELATSRATRPADALLIEFLGLLGATIAAAVGLRRIRGTADPYSLPVSLALLKMSIGPLTAFLGLLLIRAGFVPGFSALDSSAQILAWAIVLGYAQQLFTRAVDRQAEAVLTQPASSTGRQVSARTPQKESDPPDK
jgi:hypothetical protein